MVMGMGSDDLFDEIIRLICQTMGIPEVVEIELPAELVKVDPLDFY
jgi:hypothetical protein